ncbi:NAD(P)-binding domain-containing protein [Paenibacillus doosanensis]|uniref:NAD(P)/FAD-dependent oxidoreductase n=1 Tax=Paenibacillus doosanensis TaxID=1229154 RepID=UPI0021808ADC|nr:NAD(P)/FAD-dependent oxidoreductase [Paenibacillus doosanensis]MCS7464495.1 NAD(P)-binding domain-containing protein [Paenibacillus doosanensis]
MKSYDCLIVGGGAAGIGMGCALQELGVERFGIVERGEVGASFLMWPQEMRMITPSFTSNAYGMMDLNAIALKTSPAYTLGTEHPSGEDYAHYLQAVAEYKKLPIHAGVDVTSVQPLPEGGFELQTSHGSMRSRFVIWAAGEFQYPRLDGFPGAEYALHNSLIGQWREVEGEDIVVIGGYESGADAAIHLSRLGKKVTLIDRSGRWTEKGSSDPSVELSPYTKDRLKETGDGTIELMSGYEVHWIEPADGGGYLIYCEDASGASRFVKTSHQPILATGFKGSLEMIRHLFEQDEDDVTILNEYDESTKTPGLFVSGPSVTHGSLLFCFIYKFRQRFGVVAEAIGQRLGLDTQPLEEYRKQGMMLTDLSCCGEDCTC